MVYTIDFIGGPRAGETSFAIRPYHILEFPDGTVYENDPDDPDFMIWESDDSRRITLFYKGNKNGTETSGSAGPEDAARS